MCLLWTTLAEYIYKDLMQKMSEQYNTNNTPFEFFKNYNIISI